MITLDELRPAHPVCAPSAGPCEEEAHNLADDLVHVTPQQ